MSVAIIFQNKDPEPWQKALKKRLPNTSIEIYPHIEDKKAIDFAICWKPQKNVLAQFPNIKTIQSVGASIEHITNTQIIDESTTITRIVDEQLSNDMYEFLLTIIMAELKNTKSYATQQRQKKWEQQPYKSIHSTTISILGLGKIGGFVAEEFAQIGFKVNGWSNSEKNISKVKSYYGENQFGAFLESSDFLINLLPLTDQTKGILNMTTFEKMPNHAFLINVGRGEHLVEDDLIEALNHSKLSGAFLDVFREEPLPQSHPFWNHDNIQITPHVASLTNVETAAEQVVENYNRFLQNKPLLNIISLKKGY